MGGGIETKGTDPYELVSVHIYFKATIRLPFHEGVQRGKSSFRFKILGEFDMLVQAINMISELLSIIFVNNDERTINVLHPKGEGVRHWFNRFHFETFHVKIRYSRIDRQSHSTSMVLLVNMLFIPKDVYS